VQLWIGDAVRMLDVGSVTSPRGGSVVTWINNIVFRLDYFEYYRC